MTDPTITERITQVRLIKSNVLTIIKGHVGKENLIRGADIRRTINETMGLNLKNTRAIRQAIDDLVVEDGYPICSLGGNGYWYAASYREALDSKEQEIDPKIAHLSKRGAALLENARIEFGGQLELV